MSEKNSNKNLVGRKRIGEIGKAILLGVAGVGIISVLVLFPGMGYVIGPFLKKKKYRKRDIQRNLDSLIRSGLVKRIVNAKGDVKIELTTKGKWEAFLLRGIGDRHTGKWDSLWRVVIFDVPITKNKIRRELRRGMLLYGFKMLQQSVWVYPFPCDDFVLLLKSNLGVSHDVLYMKVKHIENDKHLRRSFNLS